MSNAMRIPGLEPITGRDWERQVMQLAGLLGWRRAHFRAVETKKRGWMVPVGGDGDGFPDLVLVRDRVIYAELKAGRGVLSAKQIEWRDALLRAGQEFYEWRPEQLEQIAQTLRRRTDR